MNYRPLLCFHQERLPGENGASGGQPIHPQEGREIHLVFLGNDVWRISFQDPVGSGFDFADGGGRARDDKDLADTQGGTGQPVCSSYGLGGGVETVGDFPERIPFSNRIALRRGRACFGATFF